MMHTRISHVDLKSLNATWRERLLKKDLNICNLRYGDRHTFADRVVARNCNSVCVTWMTMATDSEL